MSNLIKVEQSNICNKLNLKKKEFILASIHREENVDNHEYLKNILDSLLELKKKLKLKVIFSTHPRTRKKINLLKKNYKNKIDFHKPFGYLDFVSLMKNSALVMSDSGSITEETSILSIPSLNLRFTNERQEGMEYGTVIMTGLKSPDILNAANIALRQHKENEKKFLLTDYSRTEVSTSVVNIIQSCIPFIKNKIWHTK
jgi:UDP-N-acetylglucosamine 2-epimerase (non-hydrolysing)